MEASAKNLSPIRVLIVDDSTVMRAVIGKTLNRISPRVTVVGYAESGSSALKAMDSCDPDIVVLDIEMPGMDGLTALPLILKKNPRSRVIICSSFTTSGAEVSIKALSLGAVECVLKPGGPKDKKSAEDFEAALKNAVLMLGDAAFPAAAPAVTVPVRGQPAGAAVFRPKLVAIGSSTGGPRALMTLVKDLGSLPVPIIITQHIQEKFAAVLARHIERETGTPCRAAGEGMALEPAQVYIAPGGSHMKLRSLKGRIAIRLDDGPPENFCKPSVDVMLRSAVEAYGGGVLAVILTGMGVDGLKGCGEVFDAGGKVLVQDQESAVVWGMPGAVAQAGMASAITPLAGMGGIIRGYFSEAEPPPGKP